METVIGISKAICFSNITRVGMVFALIALTQNSVLAASKPEIAKNEAILSGFSTCKAANQAGYKNLQTRVGFKPAKAKRSFDPTLFSVPWHTLGVSNQPKQNVLLTPITTVFLVKLVK